MKPTLPACLLAASLIHSISLAQGFEPPRATFPLPPEAREALVAELRTREDRYDPAERMVTITPASYNYHSKLSRGTAHPTRQSFSYAVTLLDSGDDAYRQRALDIIDRTLTLQDTDPESRSFGIWPYYLEEPLEQMRVPDWNWADFNAVSLLAAKHDHGDRIPAPLMKRIDTALHNASTSIRKRNVGPGYTNIAIMGALVTLATAETFNDEDLMDYAMKRWARFHEHTLKLGGFNEYNSPTYTKVALDELLRILQYVKNPEARAKAREIYHIAWREMAIRHHPPTAQWAGPHSRCYHTLLRGGMREFFRTATTANPAPDAPFSIEKHRMPHQCPPELRHYFHKLSEPREVIQPFAGGSPRIAGYTYLTPKFTLGSVNRGDLWNQRRALIGYWGTRKSPAYLHLRFIKDGYDFAAAQFFSAQKESTVLAGINFASDGGIKHVSIDRIKNGRIRTSDFRLRLELGGAARKAAIRIAEKPGGVVTATHAGMRLELTAPFARIGATNPAWAFGNDGKTAWIDLVFVDGEETDINFKQIEQAAIGIALRLAPTAEESGPSVKQANATLANGRLKLNWNALAVDIPVKPAGKSALRKAALTSD